MPDNPSDSRLPMVSSKACSKCGQVKPRTEFYADKRAASGLHSQCADCCEPGRGKRAAKALARGLLAIHGLGVCLACSQVLPISVMYSRTRCKPCRASQRRSSPRQKASAAALEKRPDVVAKRAAYRKTESAKERQRRYYKSEKGLRRMREYRASNIEKARAREMLNRKIRTGGIQKQPCDVCGSPKSEAHHHNGYDPSHWYDVRWLCREHHVEAHRKAS